MQVRDLIAFLDGSMPEDHPFARISAMPSGPTAPPVWLLGSSDQSASLAAYFGCPFSFAQFIAGNAGTAAMSVYRDEYRPSERWPEPVASIGVFVLCADTEEEAERLIKCRDLSSVRQRTGRSGPVPTIQEAEAYVYSPQEEQLRLYNRQRFIWGTPDKVRSDLEAVGNQFGVDEFVVLTICPDFASRCRSYELLAEAFDLTPRLETEAAE